MAHRRLFFVDVLVLVSAVALPLDSEEDDKGSETLLGRLRFTKRSVAAMFYHRKLPRWFELLPEYLSLASAVSALRLISRPAHIMT